MNSISKNKIKKALATNLILISMLSALATFSIASDNFLLSSHATSVSSSSEDQTSSNQNSKSQDEDLQASNNKSADQDKEEDREQLVNCNHNKDGGVSTEIEAKDKTTKDDDSKENLPTLDNSDKITHSKDPINQRDISKKNKDVDPCSEQQAPEMNSATSHYHVPKPTSIKAVIPASRQDNLKIQKESLPINMGNNSNKSLKMRYLKRANIIRPSQIKETSAPTPENKPSCSIVEHKLIDFPTITSDENLINYNPETNPLPYHKEWSFSQPVTIDNEIIFGTSTETKPQVDKKSALAIDNCDITIFSQVKLDIDLNLNEYKHKVPICLMMQSVHEYKDLNKGNKISICNPHILNHRIDDFVQYPVDNTKVSFIKCEVKNERISKPEDIIRNFVLNKGEFIKQTYTGELKCMVKVKKPEVCIETTTFKFNNSNTIYATEDMKIDIIPVITNIKKDSKEQNLDYFI